MNVGIHAPEYTLHDLLDLFSRHPEINGIHSVDLSRTTDGDRWVMRWGYSTGDSATGVDHAFAGVAATPDSAERALVHTLRRQWAVLNTDLDLLYDMNRDILADEERARQGPRAMPKTIPNPTDD